MRYLVSALLVLAGIIHVLPITGVLGSERLAALYGLSFDDPNMAILMRHRAVLFGLLGAFMIIAAFRPTWQSTALIAGLTSAVSFLWIAKSVDHYNAQLARVVAADIVAVVCLVIGISSYVLMNAKS